ncbi:MAG: DUF3696 domain-containing protein [Sulfurimonas sp.]|jgi:predicted ATPase
MIKQINVSDFKCFEKNEIFDFSNLTILSGTNSSGKSSLIQSILLSGNTVSGTDVSKYLSDLGDFDNLKNRYINPKEFSIEIVFTDGEKNKIIANKASFKIEISNKRLTYPDNLSYLSSERKPIEDVNIVNNFSKSERYFGIYGSYVIDWFDGHKDDLILSSLVVYQDDKTLSGQLNYWLKYIANQEIEINSRRLQNTVEAFYSHNRTGSIKLDFLPKNIGTGLSYLISMLTICLSAKVNNIIVIENPEIHLHPKAQSRLTDFLTFVASKGVQIIIETHSDHIFNGVRKNVYNNTNENSALKYSIEKEKVALYYFDQSNHTKIIIDDNGLIENHQQGLFDQFDEDLNALLGLSWM